MKHDIQQLSFEHTTKTAIVWLLSFILTLNETIADLRNIPSGDFAFTAIELKRVVNELKGGDEERRLQNQGNLSAAAIVKSNGENVH